MSQMSNSEWDVMEERAHRCRRLAVVLRHDVERQMMPLAASLKAIDRAQKHEDAALRIESQLKAKRGY